MTGLRGISRLSAGLTYKSDAVVESPLSKDGETEMEQRKGEPETLALSGLRSGLRGGLPRSISIWCF